MKIQQWLFKILMKQNVTDGQRENSIPTTKFVGGGGGGGGGGQA